MLLAAIEVGCADGMAPDAPNPPRRSSRGVVSGWLKGLEGAVRTRTKFDWGAVRLGATAIIAGKSWRGFDELSLDSLKAGTARGRAEAFFAGGRS